MNAVHDTRPALAIAREREWKARQLHEYWYAQYTILCPYCERPMQTWAQCRNCGWDMRRACE